MFHPLGKYLQLRHLAKNRISVLGMISCLIKLRSPIIIKLYQVEEKEVFTLFPAKSVSLTLRR
jgi:hypothetical protein